LRKSGRKWEKERRFKNANCGMVGAFVVLVGCGGYGRLKK
jgi:hypothetical protein